MQPLRVLFAGASVLALSAWLTACGGGGEAAAPVAPAPTAVAAGQSGTATLGAAGGSVVLATAEGASFTLSVPAGAVPEGTALRLETAAISARQRFHLRLLPAGLVPSQPLTLTLALPASISLPSGSTLVYDGAPVPYTRLSDGRIELRLRSLAGAPAVANEARAHALTARALATSPAPACAGVPTLETADGGLTDGAPITADDYGSCMLGAVNALALAGDYDAAVRLASALGAYLQSIGAANTNQLSDRFLTEAARLACIAYADALDDAAAATITRFDDLVRRVRRILFWAAAVQQLGAVCSGVPPTRYVTVIENLTSDALRYFATRKGAVVDVGSVEYTEAVQETRAANTAVAQVRSLQAPAPVQALAQAQLQERAQPAILDAVLQAPWQRCRDGGNHDKLIELMGLMDKPASVKSAAQYCGTQLDALARNSAGATTATLSPALGGTAAGSQRTAGSITISKDGKLSLSGPIRALQCPAGQTGGSESLEIKLGSTVLQTITSAPYLVNSTEIDIAQALQAAGINADNFTGATLTLNRAGNPCGGYWGDSPAPLLALDLSAGTCVPEQGRNFCITVLADLNSSDRDFHGAQAISNRGGHIYVTGMEGGSKPAIWHQGRVTPLPNGFWGWGGAQNAATALADDGALAGAITTNAVTGANLRTFMPAVFSPATGRLTELLSAPVVVEELLPQPQWPGYSLYRILETMNISPQGRVTFTIFETGKRNGWAQTDLGFCGAVRLTIPGTFYDCMRYTRYEAMASGGGLATLKQTLKVPDTGYVQFPLFDGGTGVGHVGLADELIVQDSVLGGIGGYRLVADRLRARDLSTELPKIYGAHYSADRFGRTVTDTGLTGMQLLAGGTAVSTVPGMPAGWRLGALGIEGHLQVCHPDGTATRLIALESGQMVMEVNNAATTVTHQGRSVEVYAGCAAQSRVVDALGRMLGTGWIAAASRDVPVVFTPAGVALP